MFFTRNKRFIVYYLAVAGGRNCRVQDMKQTGAAGALEAGQWPHSS